MPPKIMDRSAENTAIPSRDLAPSPASTSAFRPAPYGRACINCVRAKCRCLIRSGENNCERRCVRLRKDCRPSTPVRKKRSAPKDSSQTARLEQKLDGLVSLLKAHSRGTISAEEIDSSLSNSSSATLTSPRPDNDVTSHRNSYSNEAQSAASSFAYSLPAGVEPSPQDAQIWFRIFQDHYLRHVPFAVPYVQSANSAQLRVEKPAFWLSIMAVTCPVIKRQVSLGRALKEIISREIIMNSARTIDLLMSILIFIHWTFFFIELGPALATFPHLAAAVITDLELDSPCQSAAATQHLKHLQYKFSAFFTIPETRTQEHRRLVLAAYHTSASCAYYHQKSESVPWSMYLDETMKVLEETSDTAADMSLITQVKCMHIMSSVSKLHARLQGWENEETTQLVVPYIRALKSQVTMLKSQMPGYVAEDAFIQLTCIFMEIAIHETVFMCVSKGPLQVDHQFEIAECLVACTQAIRAWTNKILALQATDFIGMPLVIWKQFALVVHTVKRLVDLKYPLWDREFVIKTVNLPSLLDAIRSNLNHLTTLEPWKSSNIGKEDIHGRSSRFIVNSTNWANPIWGSSQQHSDVDQAYRQLRPSHASQAEAQSRSQPVVQAAASSESSVLHERQVSSSAEVLMPSMQGPMPAEMFPYFSQDPWAEDFLGLWDSYNGARMYS